MTRSETIVDFGLVIAYLMPGCVALAGAAAAAPTLELWLIGALNSAAFGGFLYVVLAATGAGLAASTLRWFLIDSLHHWTGIRAPNWDFSRLAERTDAYQLLIENHYRYYQFYANTFVAGLFAYGSWCLHRSYAQHPFGMVDGGVLALLALFVAASRNTLQNYYRRAGVLLR